MEQLLSVDKWLNIDGNYDIDSFQGKIILVYAFQMLCPGCVLNTIPQANKIDRMFSGKKLQVIGLHTVFEHHQAMTEISLTAFLYEYHVTFPVAIDNPGKSGPIPEIMKKYRMQGTPTIILFDKTGKLIMQRFGHIEDLEMGTIIGRLF